MSGAHHLTNPRKRKRSNSPSRKKARTDNNTADTPGTTTTVIRPEQPDIDDEMRRFMTEIASLNDDPPLVPQPLVNTPPIVQTTTPTAPTTVTGPKPANPFAGKVKHLRGNFGTGYHDIAHFQATRNKSYHGVWEGRRNKVQAWVRMALNSIYDDDRFVVASKPGQDGGYTYLISMDGTTVGYLSGSSIPLGDKPPAKHIQVYLDKKGNTVSAFPSSPQIF